MLHKQGLMRFCLHHNKPGDPNMVVHNPDNAETELTSSVAWDWFDMS